MNTKIKENKLSKIYLQRLYHRNLQKISQAQIAILQLTRHHLALTNYREEIHRDRIQKEVTQILVVTQIKVDKV